MMIDGNVWLIGDPHFGKDFRNGTPLHRRGEREAMQRAQFQAELATHEANMVVMVGDLFDKPFVPLPILSQVINDVIDAAQSRPEVHFVMMAGNHDRSRQLDVQGAWDIFSLAVNWLDNVHIVNEPTAIQGIMCYPWQWDVSALEQIERYGTGSCDVFVGHWDMMSFGGDDSHICPTASLAPGKVYSGHYHEERDYEIDGVTVHCTGSMQPYAHGEGDMYVTLTVAEALARDDLHDKCVRIILEPGQDMPEIDCLQLTQKRLDAEAEEIELGEIGIGAFNLAEVLDQQFNENEVPDTVRTFIKERMGAGS